jgi:hypothetical protein
MPSGADGLAAGAQGHSDAFVTNAARSSLVMSPAFDMP